MEKILLGLLKSTHKIKLKEALITKLIKSNQQQSPQFNLNSFIDDIENQWSISTLAFDLSAGSYDLKNSESFLEHYDGVSESLKYLLVFQKKCFKSNLKEVDNIVIPKPYTDLLTHLLNLIKLTFVAQFKSPKPKRTQAKCVHARSLVEICMR